MHARLSLLIVLLSPLLPACKGSSASPELMGSADLAPLDYQGIQPLHVRDGILLAGQPSAEAFAQASRDGLRTVIDLRREEETPDLDERGLVEELGMTYVQRQVGRPDDLTPELFAELRTLLANSKKPLLLHCASSNRVGAVWLVYRATEGGLTIEEATLEAQAVGLSSKALQERALEYVRSEG